MKYEAEIDLRNANTSHALLVELVGCDRRVLDIGCAGGDLGRVLKRRGCQVAGVEWDPAAAEAAERVLDEVLIGDVNDLELVRHFGKESFDVVVFGDVLEHLVDPVAVLRKVRPLLTETGSVVASIPNVAHGSVRLALLNGRFDYRPLGLLDATHVRFFTRGSVHETFRRAGLVPVDMRRTTAGLFDTEIDVRRADFDEGVVDAVEGDPESTTYQFVLRAVPEDSPRAIAAEQPASMTRRGRGTTRVGICAEWQPDDLRTSLAVRVAHAEVARRLPGATIRAFSSSPAFRPSPHDGGMAVEALGNWSAERTGQLAAELDCIVVAGDVPETSGVERGPGRHPAGFTAERLGSDTEADCPILWSAVRLPGEPPSTVAGDGATPTYAAVVDESRINPAAQPPDTEMESVPDPLLLVPRLLRKEALARRLNFVRMMGWFPTDGPAIVVETADRLLPHADTVARSLDAAVKSTGASVVLLDRQLADAAAAAPSSAADAIAAAMATPAYRVPHDALVDDIVAVIANAAAFAVHSSSAMTLGLAYERPVVPIDGASDPSLRGLAELGDLGALTEGGEANAHVDREGFRPAPGAIVTMQAELDAHFDRIAAIADAAAAARPKPSGRPPALPPSEYVAALELAHRRMRQRVDAERRAVGDHLGALRHRHEAELSHSRGELQRLRTERDQLEARLHETLVDDSRHGEREIELRRELDRVTAELEALHGTRVLRLVRPARAIYARLRGGRL